MPVTDAPDILSPRPGDADWLAVLRADAAASSIAAAARRIGVSRTAVSLVLSGTYPAGTGKIERRVRQTLMDQVACPGLGQSISIDRCRAQAARPFSAASGRAAALWRACHACPNKGDTPS